MDSQPGGQFPQAAIYSKNGQPLLSWRVALLPYIEQGDLYRQFFGETYYSFDHRGVHFIALDNVSRGKPVVGAEQIDWLKRDIARYPKSAPVIVFTHRPLFDLRPDWEWFTRDGREVLNVLAPYENVTILYGHIHRHDVHQTEHATHYASKSLIFAFPDPTTTGDKKPLAFDKDNPFRNLPAVNDILQAPAIAALEPHYAHDMIVEAIRAELADVRAQLAQGLNGECTPESLAGPGRAESGRAL